MRVIAGEHKGRLLVAPKGAATRPTTDRVREAIFSSLASLRGPLDGAVVLDCFAGTGALGVEALSRGASFACFCDRDRQALAAIRKNTLFFDEGRFRVMAADVEKTTPPAPRGPYGLAFFDPPYGMAPAALAALLVRLFQAGVLATDALIVYEYDKSHSDLDTDPQWASLELETLKSKAFGSTAVGFYTRG